MAWREGQLRFIDWPPHDEICIYTYADRSRRIFYFHGKETRQFWQHGLFIVLGARLLHVLSYPVVNIKVDVETLGVLKIPFFNAATLPIEFIVFNALLSSQFVHCIFRCFT